MFTILSPRAHWHQHLPFEGKPHALFFRNEISAVCESRMWLVRPGFLIHDPQSLRRYCSESWEAVSDLYANTRCKRHPGPWRVMYGVFDGAATVGCVYRLKIFQAVQEDYVASSAFQQGTSLKKSQSLKTLRPSDLPALRDTSTLSLDIANICRRARETREKNCWTRCV